MKTTIKKFKNKVVKEKNLKKGIKYFEHRQLEAALYYLNKAIEKHSTNAEVFLYRGEVYYQLNQLEKAAADLEQARKLDPKNYRVYGPLLLVYLKNYNSEKSREIVNVWEAKNIRCEIFYAGLSWYYLKLGRKDYDKVIMYFKKSFAISAKNYATHDVLIAIHNSSSELVQALNKECEQLLKNLLEEISKEIFTGNFSNAIYKCYQVISLDSENSLAYTYRGYAYRWQSKRENAISDLTQALQLNPKDAQAHAVLGTTYIDSAKYDQAEEHLNQAVALDKKCYLAYFGLSKLYLRRDNNPTQALAMLDDKVEQYLSQFSKNLYREFFEFAIPLYKLMNDPRYEISLLVALDADVNAEIASHIDSMLQSRNDVDIQTLPELLADLSVEKSQPFLKVYHYLHNPNPFHRMSCKEFGKLLNTLEQFLLDKLRAEPDNVAIHYYLGETYRSANRLDDAIKHYQQFLKKYPQFLSVINKLSSLYQRQGKNPDSIQTLTTMESPTADSFLMLAKICYVEKDIVNAIINYTNAVALNKSDINYVPDELKQWIEIYQAIIPLFVQYKDLLVQWKKKFTGDSFDERGNQLVQANRISGDIRNIIVLMENKMRECTEDNVQHILEHGVTSEIIANIGITAGVVGQAILQVVKEDNELAKNRIKEFQEGDISEKIFCDSMQEIKVINMEALRNLIVKIIPEIIFKAAIIAHKKINPYQLVIKAPKYISPVPELKELCAFTLFGSAKQTPASCESKIPKELGTYLTDLFKKVSANKETTQEEKVEEVDTSIILQT